MTNPPILETRCLIVFNGFRLITKRTVEWFFIDVRLLVTNPHQDFKDWCLN